MFTFFYIVKRLEDPTKSGRPVWLGGITVATTANQATTVADREYVWDYSGEAFNSSLFWNDKKFGTDGTSGYPSCVAMHNEDDSWPGLYDYLCSTTIYKKTVCEAVDDMPDE